MISQASIETNIERGLEIDGVAVQTEASAAEQSPGRPNGQLSTERRIELTLMGLFVDPPLSPAEYRLVSAAKRRMAS